MPDVSLAVVTHGQLRQEICITFLLQRWWNCRQVCKLCCSFIPYITTRQS